MQTKSYKYFTTTLKVNAIDKEFIVDIGSPFSIVPTNNSMKENEIQKMKHRGQAKSKQEATIPGRTAVDNVERNKQEMHYRNNERNDITLLRGMGWLKKFKPALGNN